MSEPLITITTIRIKEGQADGFARLNRAIAKVVEEHEPRVIAFQVFTDDAGSRGVGLQVHPDAESMEFHMQIMKEKIGQMGDFIEIEGFTVLGTPGAGLAGTIEAFDGAGIPVEHMPVHVSGVTRSSAG